MQYKEVFDKYKAIVGVILVTASAITGVFAYASDQKTQLQAQQALIHDLTYQESRIARKQDEMRENARELTQLLNKISILERDQRHIDYLDLEIARLKMEIEEIRVSISLQNE